jgi:hypothetical protein
MIWFWFSLSLILMIQTSGDYFASAIAPAQEAVQTERPGYFPSQVDVVQVKLKEKQFVSIPTPARFEDLQLLGNAGKPPKELHLSTKIDFRHFLTSKINPPQLARAALPLS